MSSVLIGMFDAQTQAAQAKTKLLAAGFSSSAVSMTEGTSSTASNTGMPASSSGSDTNESGVSGWFKSLFGNDDDSSHAGYSDTYHEAFKRGGYGVSVTASTEAEIDKAEDILNACGAVDIDEKSAQWKKEGWTGTGVGAGTVQAGQAQKLQEIEEELKVGKRAVSKGGVRIFSRTTEVPVEETVRLREEHANIQRTAVNRPATEADFAAFKDGSIEVREMSEEAVVSKTARVIGEVEIGKTVTERDETVRDTVRKTSVDVEQLEGGSTSGKTSMAGTGIGSGTGFGGKTGSDNRDPITGELGAHPVGTAVGATAGGVAAGAAVGTVAGPVGTVVGAAVGAVAGGLAGKGTAEMVDPTTPDSKTSGVKKPF